MSRRSPTAGRAPEPNAFTVRSRPWTSGTVLELHGELDLDSVAELSTAVDAALAAAPHAAPRSAARSAPHAVPRTAVTTVVVIDCGELEFCDSSGLNAMLRAQARAAARGRRIELARPRPLVRRMLELTGATDALPIRDTAPR